MSTFDAPPPSEQENAGREMEISRAREKLVKFLTDHLPDAAQGQPIQVTDRYILVDLQSKLEEYRDRIGRLRKGVTGAGDDTERSFLQDKVNQMAVRIPAMEKLATGQPYDPLQHYDAAVRQNPEFHPANTADSIGVVINYALPQKERAKTYKE